MSRFDDYDIDFDLDHLFEEESKYDPMEFIKENPEEEPFTWTPENAPARPEPPTNPRPAAPAGSRPVPPTNPRPAHPTNARPVPPTNPRPASSAPVRPSAPVNARADTWDDRRGGEDRRRRDDRDDYEDYRRWQESSGRDRKRGVSAPLIVIIVVLVIGILVAGFMLGRIFLNYHRDRAAYDDLADEAISELRRRVQEELDAPEEEVVVNPSVPIQVDWTYLRQQNSDVIGWLYCPNTVINYPVLQTQDESFYLNHGFDKQPNTAGALFADYGSSAGVLMSNFIIYGHNMKDHSMFGTLTRYTDQSYWEQNPTMYYLTPNQNYRIELSCAHIVESTVDNFPMLFSGTAEYRSYLNQISTRCFWVNSPAMLTDYQLITLSTCSYTSGYVDPRFLVHGIMIPVD
ncbi:MAG: sortase [Oscillospiraceae bacterium]|nr:sortase [Oscillospiraceae bacterium]